MKPILPGQIYQHYKGHRYQIVAIGKHSESLEDYVIYEALDSNPEAKIWVRPFAMFQETISFQGQAVPRFQIIIE